MAETAAETRERLKSKFKTDYGVKPSGLNWSKFRNKNRTKNNKGQFVDRRTGKPWNEKAIKNQFKSDVKTLSRATAPLGPLSRASLKLQSHRDHQTSPVGNLRRALSKTTYEGDQKVFDVEQQQVESLKIRRLNEAQGRTPAAAGFIDADLGIIKETPDLNTLKIDYTKDPAENAIGFNTEFNSASLNIPRVDDPDQKSPFQQPGKDKKPGPKNEAPGPKDDVPTLKPEVLPTAPAFSDLKIGNLSERDVKTKQYLRSRGYDLDSMRLGSADMRDFLRDVRIGHAFEATGSKGTFMHYKPNRGSGKVFKSSGNDLRIPPKTNTVKPPKPLPQMSGVVNNSISQGFA